MKVIMYTGNDCPACKIAEEFLTKKNIEFEKRNIEDEEVLPELKLYKIKTLPTIIISADNKEPVVISGWHRNIFLNKLGEELLNE